MHLAGKLKRFLKTVSNDILSLTEIIMNVATGTRIEKIHSKTIKIPRTTF
jgi:hypothetical protein